MNNTFINHSFKKIIEGRHSSALSASGAKSVLEHVESVANELRSSQGDEAVQNILGYKEVKRALEQCIDFIENPNSLITDTDHTIYYDFLSDRLEKAEKIIDSELPEFGF